MTAFGSKVPSTVSFAAAKFRAARVTPGRAATARSSCAAQFVQVSPLSRNVRRGDIAGAVAVTMTASPRGAVGRRLPFVARALVDLLRHARQYLFRDLDEVPYPALLHPVVL
jgi:hypothetical protein